MMEESVKNVDVVIQMVDARTPRASTNPDLLQMIGNKKSIYILNKADLADSSATNQWIAHYKAQGNFACELNSLKRSRKPVDLITEAAADLINKYKSRGVNKTIRIMVAGIPNVGKSTFINMLACGVRAKTGDKPGVTRGTQWIRMGNYLDLLDTPGILWPKIENQEFAQHLAYTGAISDNIMDMEELVLEFISELSQLYPNAIAERYNVDCTGKEKLEILDDICRRRGWLMGQGLDYTRAAKIIIDEYRAGKLGKITWERPNDECSE
jgi:ribosome biogenesis GTPase A